MARSSVGKDGRLIAASEQLGARSHVSARESEGSTSRSWAIAHPRSGSKPARTCCERERHCRRAEFFALPVVGSARCRSPVGRFESSLPSLSSVKNLLCERRCLLVERGHNGIADGVGAKLNFESLPFRRTTHQTSLRSSGVRKIGEPQHSK